MELQESAKDNKLLQLKSLFKNIHEEYLGGSTYISIRNKQGEEVGGAELIDHSEEFNTRSRIFKLELLFVYPRFRGQGYASALLVYINSFLKKHGAMAYLENGAHTDLEIYDIHTRQKLDIKNIYERYGWEYIDHNSSIMTNTKYANNSDDVQIFEYEIRALHT